MTQWLIQHSETMTLRVYDTRSRSKRELETL